MRHRLGKHQKVIIGEMKVVGTHLYQEQGAWYYERDGDSRTHDAIASSCRSLMEHGYIYNDHTEEHPFWRGGVRWRYGLTLKGRAAIP